MILGVIETKPNRVLVVLKEAKTGIGPQIEWLGKVLDKMALASNMSSEFKRTLRDLGLLDHQIANPFNTAFLKLELTIDEDTKEIVWAAQDQLRSANRILKKLESDLKAYDESYWFIDDVIFHIETEGPPQFVNALGGMGLIKTIRG